MYSRIIIGYDDSNESRDAVELGKLIRRATGAEMVLVGITPYRPSSIMSSADVARQIREAGQAFSRRLDHAAEDIGATTKLLPSTSAQRGLHDAAEDLDADLLVVGSAPDTPTGKVHASRIALHLLQGAPCAVAVAPSGFRDEDQAVESIAVGVDGSAEATLAVEAAGQLAAALGAGLRLITAIGSPMTGAADPAGWGFGIYNIPGTSEEVAEGRLQDALTHVPNGVTAETAVLRGDAAACLAEASAEANLLFVGSRGYGPLRRLLLGSVSSEVVRNAACPVVAVPRGESETERSDDEAVAVETTR